MKIVLVGGTGLIGSKLVTRPGEHGHVAVPAAPDTGVDTLTGEGLAGSGSVKEPADLPASEWLFDPAEEQEYEVGLRGLLGAVRELNGDARHDRRAPESHRIPNVGTGDQ
ncbi:hypothetical protein [Actinocorallia populi]|uniref:hypothetical protein n=1 Tax=Actinocorallia populi TaxID=2079200 RepID=UPI0018E52A05|nr:hypothetical protein [Actinocorallia populi]